PRAATAGWAVTVPRPYPSATCCATTRSIARQRSQARVERRTWNGPARRASHGALVSSRAVGKMIRRTFQGVRRIQAEGYQAPRERWPGWRAVHDDPGAEA